jgi:hypothetical protein
VVRLSRFQCVAIGGPQRWYAHCLRCLELRWVRLEFIFAPVYNGIFTHLCLEERTCTIVSVSL